jgi:hypothetical protein
MQPVTGIYLVDSLDKNKTCTNTCLGGWEARPRCRYARYARIRAVGQHTNLPDLYIFFSLDPTVLCLSRVNSDPSCTAKTQYRKFETNISRKGIARPQSQFQHSCVCCERFMYSRCRYARYARISAVGQYTNLPDLYLYFLCILHSTLSIKGQWWPLQQYNLKNSKQIFPEKELRGHSQNFNIHVSMSDLCVLMIDLPILLQEIGVPILGIYNIIRSQTHDGNWDWGHAIPRKGIHK